MDLNTLISNFIYNKGTSILADGMTAEKVKTALGGLTAEFQGLSEAEFKSIVESSVPLKSYVDRHTTEGIKTREKTFTTETETNKRKHAEEIEKLNTSIKTLESSMPISGDPKVLREQALNEPDQGKRDLLILRADNIENKKELADMNATNAAKDRAIAETKLLDIVREEIGERHLNKTMSSNLKVLIGADETITRENAKAFGVEWDNYLKDLKTGTVEPPKPPAGGEPEKEGEAAMNEKMDKMSFLDR